MLDHPSVHIFVYSFIDPSISSPISLFSYLFSHPFVWSVSLFWMPSLCNCARDPSRPVASAGTGTNNIGRTRSMVLGMQLLPAAALPDHFSAAIFGPAAFSGHLRQTASWACAVYPIHSQSRDRCCYCSLMPDYFCLDFGTTHPV